MPLLLHLRNCYQNVKSGHQSTCNEVTFLITYFLSAFTNNIEYMVGKIWLGCGVCCQSYFEKEETIIMIIIIWNHNLATLATFII